MEQREYVVADDSKTQRLVLDDVPSAWVSIMDALIIARGGSQVVSRSKLLAPVIGAWIEQQSREATMVANVLRANGLLGKSACSPETPPLSSPVLTTPIEGLFTDLARLLDKYGVGREPERQQ